MAHGYVSRVCRRRSNENDKGKSYGKRFAVSSTGRLRWMVELAALAVAASAVYRIVHPRVPCHRFDLVHQAKGLRLRAFPSHIHTHASTSVCFTRAWLTAPEPPRLEIAPNPAKYRAAGSFSQRDLIERGIEGCADNRNALRALPDLSPPPPARLPLAAALHRKICHAGGPLGKPRVNALNN